jgi:ABC-type multidrug transport system fused ATPase/permease subunit
MAYLIVAVMMAAIYFGYPLVPVTVAGTMAIIALAYWVSRHPALLRLGASFTGYTLTHVLLSRLDADVLAAASELERTVMEFGASDKVMVTVAAVVMIIAVGVGMFGPRKEDPLADFIKKHRREQQ